VNNKFRVWDGKKMWYKLQTSENGYCRGYLLGMDGKLLWYTISSISADGESVDPAKGEILFSTGRMVKDADGDDRELYDGDIMKWGLVAHPHLICWDKDKYRFGTRIGGGYIFPLVNSEPDEWVLLGNKYENPELLTVAPL